MKLKDYIQEAMAQAQLSAQSGTVSFDVTTDDKAFLSDNGVQKIGFTLHFDNSSELNSSIPMVEL